MKKHPCPLCASTATRFYHRDSFRSYLKCTRCHLVFVPSCYFLTPAEEKKRYDLHENDLDDKGYQQFLARLFVTLNDRLDPGSKGLDFGPGPAPVLARMFRRQGHSMQLFDYFYAPELSVFDQKYDFITATEVVEHLHYPKKELHHLWRCLNPHGLLGIMTKQVRNREAFARWHYIRDQTHVAFFSEATFQWLARRWGAKLQFVDNDIILFQKQDEAQKPKH